jgi:hypothetical protein
MIIVTVTARDLLSEVHWQVQVKFSHSGSESSAAGKPVFSLIELLIHLKPTWQCLIASGRGIYGVQP